MMPDSMTTFWTTCQLNIISVVTDWYVALYYLDVFLNRYPNLFMNVQGKIINVLYVETLLCVHTLVRVYNALSLCCI